MAEPNPWPAAASEPTADPRSAERAVQIIQQATGTAPAEVRRLSGGASRTTWMVELGGSGAEPEGRMAVLQVASRPDPPANSDAAVQALVIEAARARGVPVPPVLASSPRVVDPPAGVPIESWLLMSHIEGETIARRILRDDTFSTARTRFTEQCARALARIHSIDDAGVLEVLEPEDALVRYREALDDLGHPSPAFELGFRWLEAQRPQARRQTVVHGDFRLGNVLVGPDGLNAVLDWELAHISSPAEDLGWLCVRAWRFGGPGVVAGMGDIDSLVAAYRDECQTLGVDADVDAQSVRWWMVVGTLKWGIMCVTQAARYRLDTGGTHEHAAIVRRVAENEWELLELIR